MRRLLGGTKGLKGSAASVATGAATGAASLYVLSAVPFLSSNWWTMPVALSLVGHFLKRKNPAIGDALLGIAGMTLYAAYQNRGAGAKGFIDAGALYRPGDSDAGALGSSRYNDSVGTDASPRMGTAEAAMLYTPHPWQGSAAPAQAGEFIDAGDAMGIES